MFQLKAEDERGGDECWDVVARQLRGECLEAPDGWWEEEVVVVAAGAGGESTKSLVGR